MHILIYMIINKTILAKEIHHSLVKNMVRKRKSFSELCVFVYFFNCEISFELLYKADKFKIKNSNVRSITYFKENI